MSSILELDFSITPSIMAESSTTTNKKKRSPVWAHTRRLIENENQAILYYSYYQLDLILLPYGSSNSENIRKHINRHHSKITIEEAPLSKN
jgi:hypothetical protein